MSSPPAARSEYQSQAGSQTKSRAAPAPVAVARDPRFRLARTLVASGKADEGGAADILGSLLEECHTSFGETSADSALCFYEYGNALFRAVERRRGGGESGAETRDPARDGNGNGEQDGSNGRGGSGRESGRSALSAASAAAAEMRSRGDGLNETTDDSDCQKRNREAGLDVSNEATLSPPPAKRVRGDGAKDDKDETDCNCGNGGEESAGKSKADDGEDGEDDDVHLGLDMMENSLAIFESHIHIHEQARDGETGESDGEGEGTEKRASSHAAERVPSSLSSSASGSSKSSGGTSKSNRGAATTEILEKWSLEQIPRVLSGMGDALSFLGQHADAFEAYCRALPYREEAWEKVRPHPSGCAGAVQSLEQLACRRRFVETNVLVAESLLSVPEGEDVVVSGRFESSGGGKEGGVLVKAKERLEFARGYYEKAKEDLEEVFFLIGKMAAHRQDLATEKEDVCFVATLLMGVGGVLADADAKLSAAART